MVRQVWGFGRDEEMVLGVFKRRPHVHWLAVSLNPHTQPFLLAGLMKCSSLAMAEMTTLLAAIYRRYSTSEYARQRGTSPVITSRFEVFYDETLPKAEVSMQAGPWTVPN